MTKQFKLIEVCYLIHFLANVIFTQDPSFYYQFVLFTPYFSLWTDVPFVDFANLY